MEREFQRSVSRIKRRARLVQGIERAWPPTALALLLTLGYQAARLLGLVGGMKLYWMISAALAIALGGFLWGYLSRVDLARVLFRADRRLGLNEKLSSLYQLYRGCGRKEFIPLLSSRLPSRINPAEAIPLNRGGLLLLAALIGFTLVLGLPQRPLLVHHPPAVEEQGEESPELLRRLAEIEESFRKLREEVSGLEELPQGRRVEELQALREVVEALEEELWGPLANSTANEAQKELSELLPTGEEQLHGGRSPSPELEAELNRLASRLGGGALRELLREVPWEDQTQALRDLSRIEALARGLAEAGEKFEEYEGLLGQAAGSARGEEEGVGETPQGEGEQRPSEQGPPGGEEPGTTPGERASSPSSLTMPSETREFHVPGELGELGEIDRLITKGTPLEVGASGVEGRPSLEFSFPKVIAILESREVPAELREVVKRYFLLITEEE